MCKSGRKNVKPVAGRSTVKIGSLPVKAGGLARMSHILKLPSLFLLQNGVMLCKAPLSSSTP